MTTPPAGRPEGLVAVPVTLHRFLGTGARPATWGNELDGLTFEHDGRFHKWSPPGDPRVDLVNEAERMRWARPHALVPEVVESGRDDTGEWLVTIALSGYTAIEHADARQAVRAIGEGLRRLHDHAPVDDCPFAWSLADRMRQVTERTEPPPRHWADLYGVTTLEQLRRELADPPDDDLVVVGHGDACSPNTLVDADGTFAGHVDLGRLGVVDRWSDLAVASMALGWNFGDGWEPEFFAAYGVAPDADRIRYYRLLWDVAD